MGAVYKERPVIAFVQLQAYAFGCAFVGTALTVLTWAWSDDQWDCISQLWYWLEAAAIGGFGFWAIAAIIFGQVAWRLRSWFFASALLPGLIGFPLLWWWNAASG